MKRPLAIAAVTLGAAVGVSAASPGAEVPQAPEAAQRPAQVAQSVPRAKFLRLHRLYHRERRVARALRRTLRHEPSVQEALTVASVAYGVPRGELSSVAWCESTHRPHARNGRYRGLFQFGPIFESSPYGRAGLSVWSPLASAMAAAYIVRHGGHGWSPWECGPRGAFRP